jgi:CDP-diacylglycerol--glycerol-3-phosphate 3-phosphatidyltransferase
MHAVAVGLNRASGGKITPNFITMLGLVAHIPIAWAIYQQHLVLGAVLLVIFGLMDTLDGELARLQKRTSAVGMLLDSTTDRMKEVILYLGLSAYLVKTGQPYISVVALGALGASMTTSYINAWGDVVMTSYQQPGHIVNKTLRGGFLPFEVRMFLIVVGLLFNQLPLVLYLVLTLTTVTAFERLRRVGKRLQL